MFVVCGPMPVSCTSQGLCWTVKRSSACWYTPAPELQHSRLQALPARRAALASPARGRGTPPRGTGARCLRRAPACRARPSSRRRQPARARSRARRSVPTPTSLTRRPATCARSLRTHCWRGWRPRRRGCGATRGRPGQAGPRQDGRPTCPRRAWLRWRTRLSARAPPRSRAATPRPRSLCWSWPRARCRPATRARPPGSRRCWRARARGRPRARPHPTRTRIVLRQARRRPSCQTLRERRRQDQGRTGTPRWPRRRPARPTRCETRRGRAGTPRPRLRTRVSALPPAQLLMEGRLSLAEQARQKGGVAQRRAPSQRRLRQQARQGQTGAWAPALGKRLRALLRRPAVRRARSLRRD